MSGCRSAEATTTAPACRTTPARARLSRPPPTPCRGAPKNEGARTAAAAAWGDDVVTATRAPQPICGIFGVAAQQRDMMRSKITRTPLWEWVRGAAELWRCRVPIGDTLAGARQRAGLTVAQVSEQTCIREAVIKGIEGGDYSACGGDFYARANIRSIARVVGADSGPLIAEYDALHRARGALSAVSLQELLATSVPAAARRRADLSTVGGLVASGYATMRRWAGSHAARGPAAPAHRPRGRWLSWIVVLGLVAVLGFGVYSRFSGLRPVAAAPSAAGKHAVIHQQPGPGGPGPGPKLTHAAVAPAPAPKLTHAAVAPAPAAAAPAQTITPATTGAPGPGAGTTPPARRATGGSSAAGPAHQLVHRRPLPEPAPRQGPAPGRVLPGHGHGRPDHHRRRAPAVQQADGRSGQHLPGRRDNVRPERYA
jgi:Helix-turn-helix domain